MIRRLAPYLSWLRAHRMLTGAVCLLLVSILAALMFMETQSPEAQERRLIDEIGEHMVLPAGETPVIATVAEPQKLAGQEFFADVEAGDKVLLYRSADVAVLYRPSLRRIIRTGTVGEVLP